jgi:hypothetical protein
MKYLIPVFVGGAAIIAAVTTTLAHAHGAIPYLCGYGAAAILLAIATVTAVNAHKQEGRTLPSSQAIFVLEVEGSQPLSSELSDWKFLITHCGTRTIRYVELGRTRSEIGAYEIVFKEIPVMVAAQKVSVSYEVIPRRQDDRYNERRATLWDFARDHAGERGSTYLWYDISIQYRDADDSIRDGGVVGVCFDLDKQILKTEGADYYRKNNFRNYLDQ